MIRPNDNKDWKCSKADFARMMGRPSQQLLRWREQHRMPYPEEKRQPVDLRAVLAWLADFLANLVSQDDAIMAGGDSPALERWRTERAELAELDLDQNRGELLHVGAARQTLGRWAQILRKAGEQLRRQYGNDAGDILQDALDDCDAIVDELVKVADGQQDS